MKESKVSPTYTVRIYIAGDIESAKQFLRRECYERGLCVTVKPTTFIYTGGEESGMVIGLVNYPRFPSKPEAIFSRACNLASNLIFELCQTSALIVAPDKTQWIRITPPGGRD